MISRLRATWLAGSGAVLLAVSASGVVAGATVLTALQAPTPAADTTATFEDLDGNNVDDDCQDAVVADPVAEASAAAAVDLDGDGTISVSEAARSERTGGTNCNHGGYVSGVANADEDAEDSEDAEEPAEEQQAECETTPTAGDEDADQDEGAETDEDANEETPAPEDLLANAHGKAVAAVAQDPGAIGGKNCNHGGAVSEVAKKDHDAAKAARDAAKAAREAAREGARDAARGAKSHHDDGEEHEDDGDDD